MALLRRPSHDQLALDFFEAAQLPPLKTAVLPERESRTPSLALKAVRRVRMLFASEPVTGEGTPVESFR